jgi:hypothetical protein
MKVVVLYFLMHDCGSRLSENITFDGTENMLFLFEQTALQESSQIALD